MTEHISFILNGERRTLSKADVERATSGLRPKTIQTHGVRVAGMWFPVRQVFGAATGLVGSDFTSHTARRHLAALGFEVSGTISSRGGQLTAASRAAPAGRSAPSDTAEESWHTEENVQGKVVNWLVSQGWQILSVAHTASREHGIDVVASRHGDTLGIEVKGYPSRFYADPARSGEAKPTQPSTQAGHWYSQAVLAVMRLRGRQPEMRSVIALPRFPRYESLYSETRGSLVAAGISVWWVDADGTVEVVL